MPNGASRQARPDRIGGRAARLVVGGLLTCLLFFSGGGGVYSASTAPGMAVGFNIGGGHQSIATDLAGIGGSYVINFCCPLTFDAPPGAIDIRVLRYSRSCANDVFSGCSTIDGITTIQSLSNLIRTNTAYQGQVWETGNEPCIGGQDSCSGLRKWNNNVYKAIKGTDPMAVVLGPGVLSDSTSLYNGLLYDGIAFHIYQGYTLCGQAAAWLSEGKHTIDVWSAFAISQGKPLYMTEHSNFDQGCASDTVRHDNTLALRNYMASKGVVAAIYFTEGDVNCCGTDFLYSATGLTPVGKAWAGN